MWLSEHKKRAEPHGSAALIGPVTVAGAASAVWLEGERRGVAVYAPGGYFWRPALGQELLVLKADEQGESLCAVAARQEEPELRPGEVLLRTGAASLRLDPGGSVRIEGNVYINGRPLILPEPGGPEGGAG